MASNLKSWGLWQVAVALLVAYLACGCADVDENNPGRVQFRYVSIPAAQTADDYRRVELAFYDKQNPSDSACLVRSYELHPEQTEVLVADLDAESDYQVVGHLFDVEDQPIGEFAADSLAQ